MKSTLPLLSLLILFVGIGCQQPCIKTTPQIGYYGDTTYLNRDYPNCNDTLNYYEKRVNKDSTLISEGRMVEGKRDGKWIYNGYGKHVTTYSAGVKTHILEYDKKDNLRLERTLGEDSLYVEKQFYKNGIVESEQLVNMEGFVTGHGVEYDSLGRKMAEGNHIAEPVLPDTVYMENPEPPYDLQKTTITENGGKHGPWLYYDVDGNITDTVNFDRGQAVWEGDIVGKWQIDSISSTDSTLLGQALFAFAIAISDLHGFEFKRNGSMIHFDSNGKELNNGTYTWSLNRTILFCTNQGEQDLVWVRSLDEGRLKLIGDGVILYLVR